VLVLDQNRCKKKFSLSKDERIRNKKDFLVIKEKGKRVVTDNFVIYIHKNSLGINRVGIIVLKIIGKAVKRNRVKRLLREFFRLNKWKFEEGFDILFIAKKGAEKLKYSDIYNELINNLC
jgi:ribonuclease P protein component